MTTTEITERELFARSQDLLDYQSCFHRLVAMFEQGDKIELGDQTVDQAAQKLVEEMIEAGWDRQDALNCRDVAAQCAFWHEAGTGLTYGQGVTYD